MRYIALSLFFVCVAFSSCNTTSKKDSNNTSVELVDYVNPFLGTAPLTSPKEIGYTPPKDWRVWAGLTYPGATLPTAMVQLSPITKWHSGAGYEYENNKILAFTHTNKGHWNLCNIPFLPVTGEFSSDDYASDFSHDNETAEPGYYQVLLSRYNINVELSSTLRCGYHKYHYPSINNKELVVNLKRSNEHVNDWSLKQAGDNAFSGYQQTGSKLYFYAVSSSKIKGINNKGEDKASISVISFDDDVKDLELKVGLSYVSVENAKMNLESEIAKLSFDQVRQQASNKWESLLSKIKVKGGSEREKELFYTSLYRSLQWPALLSDVNGDFFDDAHKVANKGFRYYKTPSLWDTYRNKLVLIDLLMPDVNNDIIKSLIERGEHSEFIPTFFHGDHAAPYIVGSYLRGNKNFDVDEAYRLLLNNATKEGGTRPYIKEYIDKGYISTPVRKNPNVETKAKAGVTKTLEYAYDDYSLALLAKELGKSDDYSMLMQRSKNYKNLFDSSTGLMRGKLDNGQWVTPFDAEYPYYEYMYREANAWQSTFFVPHDNQGMIDLFGGKEAFENKLDTLFSKPWNPNHIARNVSSFIGQYCHGNQPDHSAPFLYNLVDKPEKSQAIIDNILQNFYGMGDDMNALCGMDDAGEMSAWYVFSAMGIYTYSPAEPKYMLSVPIFDEVIVDLGKSNWTIQKEGNSREMIKSTIGESEIKDYTVHQKDLDNGKVLKIYTK